MTLERSLSRRTIRSLCRAAAWAGWLGSPLLAQAIDVGLSASRAARFSNPDLALSEPAPDEQFAFALVAGDFDGDSADDLATGIPFDDGRPGQELDQAGAVVVRYGVPGRGLDHNTPSLLQQSAPLDPAEASDRYGFALAACDFDADGFDDLAVGVEQEGLPGVSSAGAVQVHSGRAERLQTVGDALFTQSTPGIPGVPGVGRRFGSVLACADFDGDGFADLAIGVPCEPVGASGCAGSVAVVPGSAAGLDPGGTLELHQDIPGVPGIAEPFEYFGSSLAAGDFDQDGFGDLVVGVPSESTALAPRAGMVHVFFGAVSGPGSNVSVLFAESVLGGIEETDDQFARNLAAGDFDGDGFDDLAIGEPLEDLGVGNSVADAGQVGVVYGAVGGLDFARAELWQEDGIYFPGASESGDRFGSAIAAADFDGDGRDDLAVSHPEEFLLVPADGVTTVVMGSSGGLDTLRGGGFGRGLHGLPGPADEAGRRFGGSLATGDFDGDGHGDLAIGAPQADGGGLEDVGDEVVLYGSLFADGFETGSTVRWSGTAVGAPARPGPAPMSSSAPPIQSPE